MNFTEVIDTAKRFAGDKQKGEVFDDLLIDRLHHRYTVALLICFCIALSSYQYIGDPIRCWVPAQLRDNYEDYIDRLCYIQNTYHIAKGKIVPQDVQYRRERTLKYYQWIHFVLLLQAFFFLFPRILWQSFNNQIGLPIANLVDASYQYRLFNFDQNRDAIIQYIADCLQRYEEYINPSKWPLFYRGRTGVSLTYFYFFIKFFYLANVIFQIIFLQYFLSYDGIGYLQYSFNGFTLPESELFPQMTFCDFQIRELGERHLYTVECLLTINIFIEKIYFILWIWFGVLFFVTLVDILRLMYQLILRHSRNRFLHENFELLLCNDVHKERLFRSFPIDNFLTLKILSANGNPLIVAEILGELFRRKLQTNSDV